MHRFLIMSENFQQSARRLVKCSKSSTITRSMFKLNTVTDYYSSSRHSNPITSTFNSKKFQQISVSQNKLPTLQNFLLVPKQWKNISMERSQNRKTLAVDHTSTKVPSSKIYWPYNSNIRECTRLSNRNGPTGLNHHERNVLNIQTTTEKLQHTI